MVHLGIDVLLNQERAILHGKRVGLVTNYTMTNQNFVPVVDLLINEREWNVVKLFGPEHGMRNSAKEGEHVKTEIDAHTGLPAYSLYGDTKKPTREMLSEIDILVIDLQDIGTRYYTNMNTVSYCMQACGELGLPVVVLDRPNPLNGITREGNLLLPEYRSFVGMYPIPNRHGLTMGELARYFNTQIETPCTLHVVRAEGWERRMMLPDTGIPFVSCSPNTSGFDMIVLYPGTCLFEGTNVSLGRGTTRPFEQFGAPYIDGHQLAKAFNQKQLPGVVARPVYFVPHYSTHHGELCNGVQLHVTNPYNLQAVRTGLVLLQTIQALYPKSFAFAITDVQGRSFIDLLAGTDTLRRLIDQGRAEDYLRDSEPVMEAFTNEFQQFFLYE